MHIEWTAKAVKDMRRLTRNDRERIIAKTESYASDPESLGNQVKQLAGSDLWRLRVGNYRVIFRPEHDAIAIMVVLRVRHRREAYE